MKKDSLIYVAGHNGMVGSAIVRNLKEKGFNNIITTSRSELDLLSQSRTLSFFIKHQPDYVFLCAAKVGGIHANNTYRADFIYENLQVQNNVIHSSYLTEVRKLIFLGSSCIYPKNSLQPIKEEYLLSSELEKTNEPYAIAKITGIKMCESYYKQYGRNFISVMPTNLYGFGDTYHLKNSHVFPAMIRKFHLAKLLYENRMDDIKNDLLLDHDLEKIQEYGIMNVLRDYGISENMGLVKLKLWGSGKPYREFMNVDDAADACVYIMENVDGEDLYRTDKSQINIGTGVDVTINELANIIKDKIEFKGEIEWDSKNPDGTFRKLLDVSYLNELGWKYKISLEDGIEKTYQDYLNGNIKK